MSSAADPEDNTAKHPIIPGVPRRELYGTILLERGKEALAAFKANLKKEPKPADLLLLLKPSLPVVKVQQR